MNIDNRIFEYTKSQLLLDLPLLDRPLSVLTPTFLEGAKTFATEGRYYYYDSDMLSRLFRTNPIYLQRAFLHTVLHCLYLHPFTRPDSRYFDPETDTKRLYELSCDVSVERIIDNLNLPSVKRTLSFIRTDVYSGLDRVGANTPLQIMRWLMSENSTHKAEILEREFYCDSHQLWPDSPSEASPSQQLMENRREWEEAARSVDLKKEMDKRDKPPSDEADEGPSFEDILTGGFDRGGRTYSYRDVLRSILSVNEKQGLSPDEFDLGYYSYGIKQYGNLPLIEPVETYEDASLRELIIVIDTSYSTSGQLVKSFLEETRLLLQEQGLWALGGHIRLLQCDDAVRSDRLIMTGEELDGEIMKFQITGGGNTDFRPAFRYVDSLLSDGELEEPDGLLYFTDGLGTYPAESPSYPVAFIFTGEFDRSAVPPWALTVKIP